MADQSDVEAAIVETIAAALYPDGPAQASALGPSFRVYRGWPQSAALNDDLAAGRVNVTVFPVPGSVKLMPPFPDAWEGPVEIPGLTVTAECDILRFGGTPLSGDVVGVLVDGTAFRYVVAERATLRSVAADIAVLVRAGRPALLLNDTLRFPQATNLIARVVRPAITTREIRRQEQMFRISLWCPTPDVRDASAALIDLTLASARFLDLPDGSSARVLNSGGETLDQSADAALYRRDLLVTAEYATTIRDLLPRMLFGELRMTDVDQLV